VTDYHNPAWTEESRFRGAFDDVIIIPLVFVTLPANKILRFILSIVMRLLDYAFPLAMQIVWLPLFAAKVLGNVIVTVTSPAVGFSLDRRAICFGRRVHGTGKTQGWAGITGHGRMGYHVSVGDGAGGA
jgi:hypothetical protein